MNHILTNPSLISNIPLMTFFSKQEQLVLKFSSNEMKFGRTSSMKNVFPLMSCNPKTAEKRISSSEIKTVFPFSAVLPLIRLLPHVPLLVFFYKGQYKGPIYGRSNLLTSLYPFELRPI